jgi:hypothetical protein
MYWHSQRRRQQLRGRTGCNHECDPHSMHVQKPACCTMRGKLSQHSAAALLFRVASLTSQCHLCAQTAVSDDEQQKRGRRARDDLAPNLAARPHLKVEVLDDAVSRVCLFASEISQCRTRGIVACAHVPTLQSPAKTALACQTTCQQMHVIRAASTPAQTIFVLAQLVYMSLVDGSPLHVICRL